MFSRLKRDLFASSSVVLKFNRSNTLREEEEEEDEEEEEVEEEEGDDDDMILNLSILSHPILFSIPIVPYSLPSLPISEFVFILIYLSSELDFNLFNGEGTGAFSGTSYTAFLNCLTGSNRNNTALRMPCHDNGFINSGFNNFGNNL